MSIHIAPQNNGPFSALFPDLMCDPKYIMQLFQMGKFDTASKELLQMLEYFHTCQTPLNASPDHVQAVNILAKLLLMVLTNPSFKIPKRDTEAYVSYAPGISHIVAFSDFKTTDLALREIMSQPENFVKVLTLYTVRNHTQIPLEKLFKANPVITYLWWSIQVGYTYNCNNEMVYANLQRFAQFPVEQYIHQLPPQYIKYAQLISPYWTINYVAPDEAPRIKQFINSILQKTLDAIPQPDDSLEQSDKTKIAVISDKMIINHAVFKSVGTPLYTLKSRYHLTLIYKTKDAKTQFDRKLFDEIISLEEYLDSEEDSSDGSLTFEEARKVAELIKEKNYGTIFYPDIGMTQATTVLANMRLAPIQITGCGHPVSTYGAKIDYFISDEDIEHPTLAASQYSERLVLIPGAATPAKQSEIYKKQGEPHDKVRICLNWGSPKFHYHHLVRIRRALDKCQTPHEIIAIGLTNRRSGNAIFEEDIKALFTSPLTKVKCYQYKSYDDYMRLIADCDFCIDSYPFGSYNRLVDELTLARPLIAYMGDYFYNRAAGAVLKQLGLDTLVAHDDKEFEALIALMVDNSDYREGMIANIKAINLDKKLFYTAKERYFRMAIDFLADNDALLRNESHKTAITSSRIEEAYAAS